ncbi:hypothetical protein GWI33_006306 [Rhynchophorus ferrugineus]|uniref:Uncharacterized protein n=1 Tax=Rhynchophorus ferrugineus TaxID=354439 RepID=A0A834IG44_RHYFE|nr:hypothetical protein GWI33_006306 [Rhynchophorus ferrugineus]
MICGFLRGTQKESLGPRGLSVGLLCRDRAARAKQYFIGMAETRWIPNWESERRTAAAEGTFLNENPR